MFDLQTESALGGWLLTQQSQRRCFPWQPRVWALSEDLMSECQSHNVTSRGLFESASRRMSSAGHCVT